MIRCDKLHKKKPPKRRRGIDPATSEPIYTDAEGEFLRAMEMYKRLSRRPFPTFREVLEVLNSLGYRKVCERQPLPTGMKLKEPRYNG